MSDQDDTRASFSELTSKESASVQDAQELLRNFIERIAMDGSRDFNALQYLQGIAANTSIPGIPPEPVSVVINATTTRQLVKECQPNERIVVFDVLLSLNAITNIAFQDQDGNDIMLTMYGPNAGQGFSFSSSRGVWLPRGKSLYCISANAVSYSVMVSCSVVEDPSV